jgi:ribosomal protein L40E
MENTRGMENTPKEIVSTGSCSMDVERMRSEIKSLSSEIVEIKNKIGEYYWHIFTLSGQYDPAIGELFLGIRSRIDDIAVLEQEVQIIKDGMHKPIQPPVEVHVNYVICGSCGSENDTDAQVCEFCGIKLEPAHRTSVSNKAEWDVCHLCGTQVQEDAIFCYTCGARVKI